MSRRKRTRGGACLLGCVLASTASVACSTSPEIVATRSEQPIQDAGGPDALIFDNVELIQGCSPGRYTGEFKSRNYTDGGRGLILRGNIDFQLEQSEDGEFLEIKAGSVLSGTDNDTGAVFTANVNSESACTVGEFSVQLSDGQYTLPGWPTFGFSGEVTGTYFAEPEGRATNGTGASGYFAGDWQAYSALDPGGAVVASGRWVAYPDD